MPTARPPIPLFTMTPYAYPPASTPRILSRVAQRIRAPAPSRVHSHRRVETPSGRAERDGHSWVVGVRRRPPTVPELCPDCARFRRDELTPRKRHGSAAHRAPVALREHRWTDRREPRGPADAASAHRRASYP